MIEIEAKVSVENLSELKDKLNQIGANLIGKWEETDAFFDFEDGNLSNSDSALRLRVRRDISSGVESYRITFKGPRQSGSFKRRQEIEITVNSSEDARNLLSSIGMKERVAYTKRRDSWQMDNCAIELDRIDGIGNFIEVEGPDEDSIRNILRQLDLSDKPTITKSYLEMILENKKRTTNRHE